MQADVVYDLVGGALQEGGVQAHDGEQTAPRHARRHRDGVFLADAHVEQPLRKVCGEVGKPDSVGHRGGDGDEGRVGGGAAAQQPAQRHRKGIFAPRKSARDAVEAGGILLGSLVTPALLRDDVQEHRLVDLLDVI